MGAVEQMVTIGNYLFRSTQDTLTATGTNQATAFPIGDQTVGKDVNRFTTVASGTGCKLPPAIAGLSLAVINRGANPLQCYGNGGDTIAGTAGPTGVTQAPNTIGFYSCTTVGAWDVFYMSAIAAGAAGQAYNTNAATAGTTLTGANISGGAAQVTLNMTGALAAGANAQLPTVAQLVAAMQAAGIQVSVGETYELDIMNTSSGAFAWTITTNTGWTLNGTMTIAQNTFRKFYVTLNSLTTATLQSLGQYAIGAGI